MRDGIYATAITAWIRVDSSFRSGDKYQQNKQEKTTKDNIESSNIIRTSWCLVGEFEHEHNIGKVHF